MTGVVMKPGFSKWMAAIHPPQHYAWECECGFGSANRRGVFERCPVCRRVGTVHRGRTYRKQGVGPLLTPEEIEERRRRSAAFWADTFCERCGTSEGFRKFYAEDRERLSGHVWFHPMCFWAEVGWKGFAKGRPGKETHGTP